MKLLVVVLFIASASAGQLTNLYLPPSSISSSNTNGNTVATFNAAPVEATSSTAAPSADVPMATNSTPASNTYVPQTAISTPTVLYNYGVPIVGTYAAAATPVAILRNGFDLNSLQGSYNFEYETANHIAAQESGKQKASDITEVQGSYSYLAPNGETITLSYVADENGFRPTGDHLPTPPPVPEAILRSLEINAAEEAKGTVDNGQYLPPSSVGVVVTPQVLTPPVATQYLPAVSKPESVVFRKVVTPIVATQYIPKASVVIPNAVPTVTQYLPPVKSQSVVVPPVTTQYLPPASVNVGYKY